MYTFGCGVLVAPGIAITADHVVNEFKEHGLINRNGRLYAYDVSKFGKFRWMVSEIVHVRDGATDLALLKLSHSKGSDLGPELHLPLIGILNPKIGQKVYACGYSETERKSNTSEFPPSIRFKFQICSGEVVNVCPEGRDRAMLKWPVFEMSGVTAHGMSGGPVFTEDGTLIGINCSAEDKQNVSSVSLLWPAVRTPLSKLDTTFYSTDKISILDISREKKCFVGIQTNWSYRDPLTNKIYLNVQKVWDPNRTLEILQPEERADAKCIMHEELLYISAQYAVLDDVCTIGPSSIEGLPLLILHGVGNILLINKRNALIIFGESKTFKCIDKDEVTNDSIWEEVKQI